MICDLCHLSRNLPISKFWANSHLYSNIAKLRYLPIRQFSCCNREHVTHTPWLGLISWYKSYSIVTVGVRTRIRLWFVCIHAIPSQIYVILIILHVLHVIQHLFLMYIWSFSHTFFIRFYNSYLLFIFVTYAIIACSPVWYFGVTLENGGRTHYFNFGWGVWRNS